MASKLKDLKLNIKLILILEERKVLSIQNTKEKLSKINWMEKMKTQVPEKKYLWEMKVTISWS